MRGPTGFIRSTSSTTYVTGPTGTRIQVTNYKTVRDKLNSSKELAPDEMKFVVDNEALFAEDMECNDLCKDAIAAIHIKGRGRTRHARRRKGRHSTRRGGMGEKTLARLAALVGRTKPVPQENPQDVARRSWCDANFGRIPVRQLQCYQEAPDDVSSSKPWPANKKVGGRRSTRRGGRASRKRPTR